MIRIVANRDPFPWNLGILGNEHRFKTTCVDILTFIGMCLDSLTRILFLAFLGGLILPLGIGLGSSLILSFVEPSGAIVNAIYHFF